MTGPAALARLRRRPERLGKHRKLPATTESDMPPIRPASLPLSVTEPAPAPVPAEPDTIVECGFCHVTGLSSQIPETAGGARRCFPDIDGCVQRSLQEGRPRPLLSAEQLMGAAPAAEPAPPAASPLEPLPDPEPVLPPEQEAALENFQAAHDAQDAAEGKERSEDEEPREADESAVATAEAGEPVPEPHEDTAPGDGAQGGDYT